MELTEQQRKMAAEYEKQQSEQRAKALAMEERKEACIREADAVAKFLMNQDMRVRKTQLSMKGTDGKPRNINCEYVVGKDLHFTVMQNAKKIMPMVPNINKNMNLNDLTGIRDSCALIMILIQLGKMNRVVPNHLMYQREDKDAKKPKSVTLLPMEKMVVNPFGFYIFQVEQGSMKQTLWLVFIVFLIFFFLLFRVWPEWLRLGVWYVSWYLLCFLIGTAIVRAIVWFVVWHIGVDFWIFPNYFIDSDNILDSFMPVASMAKCEDMFDFRMLILRVGSAAAIFYGAQEFLKNPANLDDLLGGSTEILDEVYDWGHNKFMGVADNTTQIEVKKSARQIYAEAFMDDERDAFRTSTQFNEYADEDDVKDAHDEFKKRMQDDDEDDEDEEQVDLDAPAGEEAADDDEDILDKLTGNVDDDEEDILDKLTGNVDEGEEAAEAETQASEDGGSTEESSSADL